MKNTKICKLFGTFLASLLGTFIIGYAYAAGSGMTVEPGFIRVSFNATTKVQSAAVAISNNGDSAAEFNAQVVDVNTFSPLLTPLTTNASAAAKAVTIQNPAMQVEAHHSVNFLLSIDGTELAPGGHYAAVIIKQVLPTQQNKSVPLQQAVAVTLFLTKEQGAVRKLLLKSALPKGIVFKQPSTGQLSYENAGNTDITPRAVVTIFNGKQTLFKALSDSAQKPLLPGQKVSSVPKTVFLGTFRPGKYTYSVQYRYDGQTTPDHIGSTFWYFPWWFVLAVTCGVIALGILLVRQRHAWHRRLKKLKLAAKTAKYSKK